MVPTALRVSWCSVSSAGIFAHRIIAGRDRPCTNIDTMTTAATMKIMKSRFGTDVPTDNATARDTPPRRPAMVLTTRSR